MDNYVGVMALEPGSVTVKVSAGKGAAWAVPLEADTSNKADMYIIGLDAPGHMERGKVETEAELSLNGGYETGGDTNRLVLTGEGVMAAKTGAAFFQGAFKVDIREGFWQYGLSAGAGYEPGKMGVFLFADGLWLKDNDYATGFHLQLRPTVRFKWKRFTGSVFYAKAVTKERALEKEWLENGIRYGLFQRAIDHVGADVAANFGGRLYTSLRAIVGKDLYSIDFLSSYKINRKLSIDAGYTYTHTGDTIHSFANNSRVYAGITMGLGAGQRFEDLERRLIVKPDYPIVANVKKELEQEELAEPLIITISGSPTSGTAPLSVGLDAVIGGGISPYEVGWMVDNTIEPGLRGVSVEKVFASPGTYRVKATVIDAEGRTAISNTVTIVVSAEQVKDKDFVITATSGNGGTIDPSGSVTVKAGSSQVFFMKPNPGFRVAAVRVDGANVGAVSSYTFKNVSADHTIHVEFEKSEEEDEGFVIDASAGPGGSISPSGSVHVNAGSDAHFVISPQPGFRVKRVIVDGKDLGVLSDYLFEKVEANRTIHAEFEAVTYTVTATAGSGGAISPTGVTTVKEGDSLTVVIAPEDGFEIASVTVDGKAVGAVKEYTFSNIAANHTIHAEFTKTVIPTFTINASSGPGGAISPEGGVEVAQNSDASFVVRPIAGYRILSVTVDGANVGPLDEYTFKNIVANHTIHATFQRITHTITATAGQGGAVDPAGSVTVNQGDSRTVAITPATGYRILDVRVDGKGVGAVDSYTFANITADHTLQATFQKKTFTVTATAGSGGGIDPSGTTTVEYGDALSFEITPAVGYKIQDVLVDGVSKGAVESFTFSNITANHTIVARFEILRFTIQAASGAGGSIQPGGVIMVDYGQSRSFRMESDDPLVYELDTVMVDGKSVGSVTSYNFTNITANHTIRASWKKRQYKIDASASIGGTITPAGTRFYAAQSTPTYTITPADGYEIDRVTIDGIYQAGKVNTYTFKPLYADHTIRALFKRKSYTILIRKAYSDDSSGAPPNPVDPIGEVTVNHGDSLTITIDNHFQGGSSNIIYSLDYISVDGATYTYRGDTKSVITHTIQAIMSNKEVVCYFYRRTN